MLDNELIVLFRGVILAGLAERGLTDVVVKQANQPTQQGANTGRTVYFFKLDDVRYGTPHSNAYFDTAEQKEKLRYVQVYETTFQIEALVRQIPQEPVDIMQYTASDLVNVVAEILQSDSAIQSFIDADVGILRITNIRNTYFVDDRGQHEAVPSFDFTLTHKQIYVKEIGKIDRTITTTIYEVD